MSETKKYRNITLKDVARVANVSLGSASRVINRNSNVTRETKERVEKAISELGYVPNTLAQSMRRRVSKTVGLLLRDLNIPAFSNIIAGSSDILNRHGYITILACTDGNPEHELQQIESMIQRQADALMLCPFSETDDRLLSMIRECEIPIVLFNRQIDEMVDSVNADYETATRIATEHLLSLGHRRIALITGSEALYPSRARAAGYAQAHALNDATVDPNLLVMRSFLEEDAEKAALELVAGPNPPTAILAGGHSMLPGVLRALARKRFRVPEDISIVGTNTSDLALLHTPPISTIDYDMTLLGKVAAELLISRIGGQRPKSPVIHSIPMNFFDRGSIAPPPR